ncbi:MAG: hypothetical protein H7331_01210 [Bacteroidia bacterium]|nr:hypothetical protein [Bacteroidia bacterium]
MKPHFLIAIVLLVCVSCNKFAAGSYPYAEYYELNTRESIVIKAIERVKEKHPELCPPSEAYTFDGRDELAVAGRDKRKT